MKQVIACVAAVAVLSVGAAGTAFAAEGEPTGAQSHQGLRRGVVRTAGLAAAEAIGIEPSELRAALKAGSSVAEVAQSKGVEVATVTDAIVAALAAKVDQALANGKITAERAAKAKERLPSIAERLVNRKRPSSA